MSPKRLFESGAIPMSGQATKAFESKSEAVKCALTAVWMPIRKKKLKKMMLDNPHVHHHRLVKQWLDVKEDQIELFFLPSYSPELNPNEYCELRS